MQIIIDIPEDVYTRLFDNGRPMDIADGIVIDRAIRNGTPLTQGHGDLKDELDLDLFAPNLGTSEYVNDLMSRHNIDYVNGDDEDKVRAFALDLIHSCMNVIETAPTVIEADKEAESIKEPCDDYDVSYCEQRDCVECEYNLHI